MSDSEEKLTTEKLAAMFAKLKAAPSSEKSAEKSNLDDYFWSFMMSQGKQDESVNLFVEIGGPKMVEEILGSDDFETTEVLIVFLAGAFQTNNSEALAIELAASEKCVDRFVSLLGKLGDEVEENASTKMSSELAEALFYVTLGLTRPREHRKTLASKLAPILMSKFITVENRRSTQALIALANLIGASENPEDLELIKRCTDKFENLVYGFSHSNTKDWSGFFKAKDLLTFLLNMSWNDINRQILFKSGVVDEVVDILNKDSRLSSDLEIAKCLQLMINLAVDKPIAQSLAQHDAVKTVIDVKKSHADNAEIQEKANRALWMLQCKHSVCSGSDTARAKDRVLISFSYPQRELAEKLRDTLKQNDFDVFIKADQTEGQSLECMLQAVEKADVVVLCLSDDYKDCPNCRMEAELVRKIKPFVAVAATSDYKPSGWLVSVAGSKLCCDLTKEDKFDETVECLTEAVKKAIEADFKGPTKWNAAKVGKWLTKNGYDDVAATFVAEEIDGNTLLVLANADLKYFESLVKTLGVRKIGKILSLRAKLTQLFQC